jgi:hypothetical protein
MGLNQIKNVFHIKGNNYQNRDNPQMGKKSLQAIYQRINTQNIYKDQKLNTKRTNNQLTNGQMN